MAVWGSETAVGMGKASVWVPEEAIWTAEVAIGTNEAQVRIPEKAGRMSKAVIWRVEGAIWTADGAVEIRRVLPASEEIADLLCGECRGLKSTTTFWETGGEDFRRGIHDRHSDRI